MPIASPRGAVSPLKILVHPSALSPTRAIVQIGPLRIPAAIGRKGRTSRKREGDGATPMARMKLLYGFVRTDRTSAPPTRLPFRPIAKTMLWCDAPSHPSYNRLVSAPFAASHEEMRRGDGLYNVCLVLDWNLTERKRNCGSAIFFHLIRGNYEPTAGCIAVAPRDMRRLLPHLRKGTVVQVL